jgi:hypothetical protein
MRCACSRGSITAARFAGTRFAGTVLRDDLSRFRINEVFLHPQRTLLQSGAAAELRRLRRRYSF